MSNRKRKSMLCPNCRRIVSIDEPRCPHCGISSPGSWWKNNPLIRGWGSGEQLIRLIIYTNIGMYLICLMVSKGATGFGLNPLSLLSPSTRGLVQLGATGTFMIQEAGWWTLISANYLHGSALHIFFNMMAFYQIAPLITRLFGAYRFFIIFTISGIGGFFVSFLMGTQLTVGASAALCGLIGAALYYGKSRGGLFGESIYRQIGGWAIGIIIFGFFFPQVNNAAHIGGMVCGGLSAFALGYSEKIPEKMLHRTLAGATMIITVLILVFALFRGVLESIIQ